MSDPGMTSEQRAAVAVHYATQNRICLDAGAEGEICIACAEVADQIDAAVEVERQAAEERGRRRGVEEAAQYIDMELARSVKSGRVDPGPRALSRGVRALAPRDSAPQPARMDAPNGPRCWCGKPSRHQSGWCGGLACQGGAPRDSGPRKHRCMRCGGEFDCTAPGCVALYDVLPRMVRDGVVVEHDCKPRDSGKEG